MAAASIVLNNALCFLKNKFGKSGVKPLKSTVLDFYDVEDLSGAKRQLISDIKDLNLDIAIPHVRVGTGSPGHRVSNLGRVGSRVNSTKT